MRGENFDLETDYHKRHSLHTDRRQKSWSKFNCIALSALILFAGFFVAILFNFLMGEKVNIEADVTAEILSSGAHAALSEDEETCENICMTRECVTEAARILTFMDDSKNPCRDFYGFACGNYPKEKPVRFGEDTYDPHNEVADNIDINIKKLMDRVKSIDGEEGFTKMKFLYDSCMNATQRAKNSPSDLTQFFERHGLTWPVLSEEQAKPTSWTHFVGEMEKYGIHTLFQSHVVHLDVDITSVVLICSMPVLSPRLYFNPNDEDSASEMYFYKNVLLLLLDYMGIRISEAKKVFEDIMKIEQEIAQLYTGENAIDEECNKPCARPKCAPCVAPSTEVTHPLTWRNEELLEDMYSEVLNTSKRNIHIRPTCSGSVEGMVNILNSASNKTIANYIGWRAAIHLLPYMNTNYKELYNHYAGRMVDSDTIPGTRWRECSQLVRNNMGVVVAQALIRDNYFKKEQTNEVEKRFSDVKDSFIYLLHSVSWIGNETMSFFINKLKKANLQIGYLDKINQSGIMNAIYKDLDIESADSYFENAMKLRLFLERGKTWSASNTAFLKYLKPLDSFGKYNYETNTVEIGLGNLIYPLLHYGPGLPKYLEHGQNVILAHQISHAFDSTGITHDADGKKIGYEHVPTVAKEKFEKMLSCMSQKHPLPRNPGYYGSLANFDPDIADLGSYFITAAGLHRDSDREHEDSNAQLPALSYTKQQIYFLQISQMFCETRETYSSRLRMKKPRSQRERVNNAISNLVHFGEVFNCASRTRMNPIQKCNMVS